MHVLFYFSFGHTYPHQIFIQMNKKLTRSYNLKVNDCSPESKTIQSPDKRKVVVVFTIDEHGGQVAMGVDEPVGFIFSSHYGNIPMITLGISFNYIYIKYLFMN